MVSSHFTMNLLLQLEAEKNEISIPIFWEKNNIYYKFSDTLTFVLLN